MGRGSKSRPCRVPARVHLVRRANHLRTPRATTRPMPAGRAPAVDAGARSMARPAGMIGLASGAALATDDPRYTAAQFPPNKLLYLMQLAEARGIDSRGWFAGLALSRAQIADPALRVSYRQASVFVRRALAALDVPDAGLRIGREGTIGGFGLLGLAMMTSRTLGEAMLAG